MKVLKIIIVDSDAGIRRRLKSFYLDAIWLNLCGKYDKQVMFEASGVVEALPAIRTGIDIVVFSDGFPEEESDQLLNEAGAHKMALMPIRVRL